MELTPEERRKIYEEEKARLEAGRPEREKRPPSPDGATGLAPNVAGLLCYLGAWVTGIIFFVLESRNKWVRFHAAQSIVTFGGLFIISLIFGWIPFVGHIFSTILGILGFILWIVLMVKAYRGEYYKLPVAGDIAEMIVASSGADAGPSGPPEPPATPEAGEKPGPPAPIKDLDRKIERKVEDFFERRRAGRITGAVFAIAWCIALLVIFNFFHQYIAYYHADTFAGMVTWERYPFFTDGISIWLPVLTTALVVAIIGHLVLIFFDNYVLWQVLHVIMDAFGLAAVVTLLYVFPFDFSALPSTAASAGTQIGVIALLVLITIGMSIGILVRVIRLIINLLRGTASYRKAI